MAIASKDPQDFSMELGPMGPIGESHSLLLRINRNCPWNRCLFCPVYKGLSFSTRTAEEIKADIDAIRRTCELLDASSWYIGMGGRVSIEVVRDVIRTHPGIYGVFPHECSPEQIQALATLRNVANWVLHGSKRVFLQDADALAMSPSGLLDGLSYLKKLFPAIEVISTYTRSKTCHRRSLEDLALLKENGLSLCLMGIETGSDQLLSFMQKGVTSAEHVDAGQKLRTAGISVAAFVMPGLGGGSDEFSGHMTSTIKVLNAIKPEEIRVRSLAIIEGTPLYREWQDEKYTAPGEEQMIEEIRLLIQGLTFDCMFESLQMTNTLFTFRGQLSRHRDALLERISGFKTLSADERAGILLDHCTEGGYLDYILSAGRASDEILRAIDEARRSISQALPDAMARTNAALFMIKSKGIP
jgi:hypothetical protein